jgi:FtsP/CotA-like multicopper oxidase with cupredoxin domain
MKTRKGYPLSTGALLLVVAALLGFAAWGPGTALAAPAAQVPGTAMTPLPDAACTLVGTTRTCDLWALAGTLALPGSSVPVWGFADSATGPASVPGPVIRANLGETLQIVFHNQLAGQTVSLHFPGQEGLVPDLTGVASGGTATYTFVVSASGTFLYEAGLTSGGSRQVAMGLFGPLVVADAAPTWNQEVLLVFSEIDPDFNANPTTFSMIQFAPQYWLINGKAYPDTGWIGVTAGQTVLVRHLNAGVQYHSIGLLGLSQEIVRKDGAALPFPMGAVQAVIPPGQSVDATVAIPATAAQDTAYALYDASMRQHNNNQHLGTKVAFGGMLTFFQVTTGGAPPPDTTGPQVSGLGLSPNPTNSSPVTLTGTANDTATGNGPITAAQYRLDVRPTPRPKTTRATGARSPRRPS